MRQSRSGSRWTGARGVSATPGWTSKARCDGSATSRSEEHTSELQSLMRISYAVFCLKKKKHNKNKPTSSLNTTTLKHTTAHGTNYESIHKSTQQSTTNLTRHRQTNSNNSNPQHLLSPKQWTPLQTHCNNVYTS